MLRGPRGWLPSSSRPSCRGTRSSWCYIHGNLPPLHVLVIEDDPDARDNLRDVLKRTTTASTRWDRSPRHSTARSGRITWPSCSTATCPMGPPRHPPPARAAGTPAARVIVTAYTDVERAIAAFRLGASDYLLRPINPDELRARIGRIAERWRAEDVLRTMRPSSGPSWRTSATRPLSSITSARSCCTTRSSSEKSSVPSEKGLLPTRVRLGGGPTCPIP